MTELIDGTIVDKFLSPHLACYFMQRVTMSTRAAPKMCSGAQMTHCRVIVLHRVSRSDRLVVVSFACPDPDL